MCARRQLTAESCPNVMFLAWIGGDSSTPDFVISPMGDETLGCWAVASRIRMMGRWM